MRGIYLDTEFTDLFAIFCDIKLISAGFVADNGTEFYAELTDNYDADQCSSFVHAEVLPHLDFKKHGMKKNEFMLRLKCWIEAFKEPVEIHCDSVCYDWGLLYDLWNERNAWPVNLVRKAVNQNSQSVQQGIYDYFQHQPMAIQHHALWDARALADAC